MYTALFKTPETFIPCIICMLMIMLQSITQASSCLFSEMPHEAAKCVFIWVIARRKKKKCRRTECDNKSKFACSSAVFENIFFSSAWRDSDRSPLLADAGVNLSTVRASPILVPLGPEEADFQVGASSPLALKLRLRAHICAWVSEC